MRSTKLLIPIAVFSAFLCNYSKGADVVLFRSQDRGFQVTYPATWFRCLENANTLCITNFDFQKRVRGVVLPVHGAEIVVSEGPETSETVSAWIHRYADGQKLDSTRVVSRSNRSPDRPTTYTEISWTTPMGPGVSLKEYAARLEVDGRFFQIHLSYWKADNQAEAHLRVYRSILDSFLVKQH